METQEMMTVPSLFVLQKLWTILLWSFASAAVESLFHFPECQVQSFAFLM
jgi:hypothetical protein